MIPHVLWSTFYHGEQEDASEFLMRLLNAETGSPRLAPLFAGLDIPELACTGESCGYRRPAAQEAFNTIVVQLRGEDGRLCPDVQTAVASYMQPEIQEADFRWLCPACGSTAPPRKEHRVTVTPEVLLVQLCRWRDGTASGAILDAVHVNERIRFAGSQYRLSSSIMHMGSRPTSGHYLTCARHESAGDAWFLYNDTLRRFVREGERESSETNKSYILFYEHVPAAV